LKRGAPHTRPFLRQEADPLKSGNRRDRGIPATPRQTGQRLVPGHDPAIRSRAAFPDHRLGEVPLKRRDRAGGPLVIDEFLQLGLNGAS
jgi:hypothetical protein